MKAFLCAGGAEQVLGHSVADLAEECARLDADFRALQPRAVPLGDHYYVPTRYPNSLPGGSPPRRSMPATARRALELAREVLGLVRAKLAAAP